MEIFWGPAATGSIEIFHASSVAKLLILKLMLTVSHVVKSVINFVTVLFYFCNICLKLRHSFSSHDYTAFFVNFQKKLSNAV